MDDPEFLKKLIISYMYISDPSWTGIRFQHHLSHHKVHKDWKFETKSTLIVQNIQTIHPYM